MAGKETKLSLGRVEHPVEVHFRDHRSAHGLRIPLVLETKAPQALQTARGVGRMSGGEMSDTMACHFPIPGAALLEPESLDVDRSTGEDPAGPTLEEFVRWVFVPEHVATKQLAGRTHYRAILKHVIHPRDVDRIFDGAGVSSRSRLKGEPGWPYIGSMQLRDIRPRHVQDLIAAAMAHGYSTQTVTHIRRAISAVFACAGKRGLCPGENPGAVATCPAIARGEAHVLTLDQTRAALQAMRYPEKEMTLIALLTGMNLAEVCGLQWKFVNMTSSPRIVDDAPVAPLTISVRKTCRRGQFVNWTQRNHNAREVITDPLLAILGALSRREQFTGPDDFVLVSRTGKPLNERYIAVSRLKVIGDEIGAPWLSWQVLRRTRADLLLQFGVEYQRLILIPPSGSPSCEPLEEAASEAPGSERDRSQARASRWLGGVIRALGLRGLWRPHFSDAAPRP